jgi:hypothetical protein
MPQFDFRLKSPQGQVQAGGPLDQGTGINANAGASLAQGLAGVEQMARQRVGEQADSDMSAFQAERIRREQVFREKSASITNAGEYKKAVDKYVTDLNKYAAGKREDGTKVFRNGMGSQSYKEFSRTYNAKFQAAGSEHSFQLDRKRDKLNYRMSINSGIENNNPDAITQSFDGLQNTGHLTPEERQIEQKGAIKKMTLNHFQQSIATMTLGAEELLIQSTDLKQTTETITSRLEAFKAEVYANKNLEETERVHLLNSAKSSLSNTQKATQADKKARGIQIEKEQLEYQTNAMIEVHEGKREISSIFHDPNISQKYKEGKLSIYAKGIEKHKSIMEKENKTLKDKTKANELQLGYDIENSATMNIALGYDPAMDTPQGTHKAALLDRINTSLGMNAQTKSDLRQMVKDANSMPAHIKASKDNHIKDFNRILGLTDETFKAYQDIEIREDETYFDAKKAVIDTSTGVKTVDGLDEYKRVDVVNQAMMQYGSLMRAGKEKEAEEYMTEVKMKYEKSEDDAKLYNSFFTEKIKYK